MHLRGEECQENKKKKSKKPVLKTHVFISTSANPFNKRPPPASPCPLCLPRRATTLLLRESSEWTRPVHRLCSTASCTRCPTIDLAKCRWGGKLSTKKKNLLVLLPDASRPLQKFQHLCTSFISPAGVESGLLSNSWLSLKRYRREGGGCDPISGYKLEVPALSRDRK